MLLYEKEDFCSENGVGESKMRQDPPVWRGMRSPGKVLMTGRVNDLDTDSESVSSEYTLSGLKSVKVVSWDCVLVVTVELRVLARERLPVVEGAGFPG